MSTCESCDKTSRLMVYQQDTIQVDPALQEKVLEILKQKFNVTGIQALNQKFLEKLLKGTFR